MPTKRKPPKLPKAAQKKVGTVMHEFKHGELHQGKSKKLVKDRKQAIAIGISEARRAWAKAHE